MKHINRKNHFIWLTLSLVGLLITSAFSRDISNNLTLVLIEYSSIALLFLSFRSLNSDKKWGKSHPDSHRSHSGHGGYARGY